MVFCKLGLYSDLARQDILKASNYIASRNLKPTTIKIDQFRKDMISGTYPEIENLQKRSVFLSSQNAVIFAFTHKSIDSKLTNYKKLINLSVLYS
tara:strand:- start:133 stop:417 length:285 start_codon:yes stop_codon:yes gene_type:complete